MGDDYEKKGKEVKINSMIIRGKEVIMMDRSQVSFIDRWHEVDSELRKIGASIAITIGMPRIIAECIVFITVGGLVAGITIRSDSTSMGTLIEIVVMAGGMLRLIPNAQQLTTQ